MGAVEEEGIRRAKQRALESDIIVVLASVESGAGDQPFIYFDEETLDLAAQADACMVVVNKADSLGAPKFNEILQNFQRYLAERHNRLGSSPLIAISCKEAHEITGAADPGNIQQVIDALAGSFENMTEMPTDLQDLLGVTERQRQLLLKCKLHLEHYMAEAQQRAADNGREADTVLAAEHLRYAADCLARITGKGEAGDVEDVLGVIFEKYVAIGRPSVAVSLTMEQILRRKMSGLNLQEKKSMKIAKSIIYNFQHPLRCQLPRRRCKPTNKRKRSTIHQRRPKNNKSCTGKFEIRDS